MRQTEAWCRWADVRRMLNRMGYILFIGLLRHSNAQPRTHQALLTSLVDRDWRLDGIVLTRCAGKLIGI